MKPAVAERPTTTDGLAAHRLFAALAPADRDFLERLTTLAPFTHQQTRQLIEAACDLRMWQEPALELWWQDNAVDIDCRAPRGRKRLLARLSERLQELRRQPNHYPPTGLALPPPAKLKIAAEDRERRVAGRCPVASEETVCCNLRTIDAVENCGFGCSYCTIQTFYGEQVAFDRQLREKLLALDLDPARRYHYCTGQSSDSLMWGNRHGVLDDLCAFAEHFPNVLLELKTKSRKIDYFLQRPALPRNLVCSWSLNTPVIVRNEEKLTASLDQRLASARRLADRGVRVAFHFHPMVWHEAWAAGYADLAQRVQALFAPEEVLFISFGSITFIKPVMKAIRARGGESKILQMELARDPKGKYTYPDRIKNAMFANIHEAFGAWHGRVFFYLCMEAPRFWETTFGWCFPDNASFERALLDAAFAKLPDPGRCSDFVGT